MDCHSEAIIFLFIKFLILRYAWRFPNSILRRWMNRASYWVKIKLRAPAQKHILRLTDWQKKSLIHSMLTDLFYGEAFWLTPDLMRVVHNLDCAIKPWHYTATTKPPCWRQWSLLLKILQSSNNELPILPSCRHQQNTAFRNNRWMLILRRNLVWFRWNENCKGFHRLRLELARPPLCHKHRWNQSKKLATGLPKVQKPQISNNLLR